MKKVILILAMLIGVAHAHEMTPTYPKWENAHISDILVTKMDIFNKRKDIEYYEIGLFDKDFKPIPFVSAYTVVELKYLGHLSFEVFINKEDKERAIYLCSKSKLRKGGDVRAVVSSRICSKFKE